MTTRSSVQALQRPKWWLLSMLMPLMGGMMFWEHRFKLSAFWHQFFGVAMILLVYGLMGVWLWLNSDYFASSESTYFVKESTPLSRLEAGASIIVYNVDEHGQIVENDQEQESWVRPPDLLSDSNSEFDISATISEIEAELQADYTRLHSHHI